MNQFSDVARDLDLTFITKRSVPKRLARLYLFSRGGDRGEIRNYLYGRIGDASVAIFDYCWWIASSDDSYSSDSPKEIVQSVVYFRSHLLQLPRFDMRPERAIDKIGCMFGYQDIDFPDHRHFSKKYLLRGDDESRIRELFDDELLIFLETQKNVSVEADGDQFILYSWRKCIMPGETKEFMQQGARLFNLLRERPSPSCPAPRT